MKKSLYIHFINLLLIFCFFWIFLSIYLESRTKIFYGYMIQAISYTYAISIHMLRNDQRKNFLGQKILYQKNDIGYIIQPISFFWYRIFWHRKFFLWSFLSICIDCKTKRKFNTIYECGFMRLQILNIKGSQSVYQMVQLVAKS